MSPALPAGSRSAGRSRQPSLLRRAGETALWALLIGAAALAVLRLAAELRLVVLPVLLAFVLATLLAPPAAWLRRRGWPPAAAAATVLVAAVVAVGAVAAWLVPTIARRVGELGFNLSGGLDKVERWLVEGPLDFSAQQVTDTIGRVEGYVRENTDMLARGAISGASLALELVSGLVLTVFVLFFLLKDGETMWRWVRGLAPRRHRRHVRGAGERAWSALGGFFRAQTLVAAFDATFIGLGLVVLGVPLALPLAVLTFFSAYVPFVGAVTAGAAAVLVALVTDGTTTALLVLALILVVQQVEGNVLHPLIMARALSVHPVLIILGVTAGGVLAGLIGTIVATPLLAAGSGVVGYFLDEAGLPGADEPEPAPE